MIDINLIRTEKEKVKDNIKKKFQEEKLKLVDEVYDFDICFRNAKKEADDLRGEKNKINEQIGSLMREGKKEEAMLVLSKINEINERIAELE